MDSIPWAWLLEAAVPPHTALADAAVTSAATTAAAAAATAAATASARGGDAEKRGRGRQAMPDKEKATKAPPEPPPDSSHKGELSAHASADLLDFNGIVRRADRILRHMATLRHFKLCVLAFQNALTFENPLRW